MNLFRLLVFPITSFLVLIYLLFEVYWPGDGPRDGQAQEEPPERKQRKLLRMTLAGSLMGVACVIMVAGFDGGIGLLPMYVSIGLLAGFIVRWVFGGYV